jgi:SAM-dependent methyltransferase
MLITPAHRDHFEGLIARLVRAGLTPIALHGGGRVCEQLRPGLRPGSQHICAVIDDNPAKHGKTIAGIPITSFDDAISRGTRSVIITAEGPAQTALWNARARFRERGIYILTAPPRFESKTWDETLIDEFEYSIGQSHGSNAVYLHDYPKPHPPKPAEFINAVHERLGQGGTALEIGAGTGLCTQHIIPAAGAYHIVDFSQRLLYEAIEHRFAKHLSKLHLHHDETATLLGVPDASIDVALSFDVFVHFKSDLVHQFLESLARVLKPTGTAVIHFARWNAAAIESWRRENLPSCRGTGSIIHYNHPEELAASAAAIGLKCKVIAEMISWQYLCEFRRA